MSFREAIDQLNWHEVQSRITAQGERDVCRTLDKKEPLDWYDFLALVSPAAAPLLDTLLTRSRCLTEQQFGRQMKLYVPLYLSNFCHNSCLYCGYRMDNAIPRTILTDDEIRREMAEIGRHGFKHVLIVTGDYPKLAGLNYLERAVRVVREEFPHVSLEVQPLRESEYRTLIDAGAEGVYIYQETYHRENYRRYHPRGMKSHFYRRLETPERLVNAGMARVGLGVLLGLEDWRTDSAFVALHTAYLYERYPDVRCSVSFPRLRPAEGSMPPNVVLSDEELLQLIAAYRVCFPRIEMALSTRESGAFRDRAIEYGITSMSAGSRTNPGGYATHVNALEQFDVCDERSAEEVVAMLEGKGFEVVWSERESMIV